MEVIERILIGAFFFCAMAALFLIVKDLLLKFGWWVPLAALCLVGCHYVGCRILELEI